MVRLRQAFAKYYGLSRSPALSRSWRPPIAAKLKSAGRMMLADQVSIARRFQRSIRLDADLARVDALQGFVCQRSAADGLTGMATQITQTAQRAFTWTGPYGGGKSSLAVTLAGLLGPKAPCAPRRQQRWHTTAQASEAYQPGRDGWLVVPVVGRRADPVGDIAAALEQATTPKWSQPRTAAAGSEDWARTDRSSRAGGGRATA